MKQFNCLENRCAHHCCKEFEGISEKLSPSEESHSFSDIFLTKEDISELVSIGYGHLIIQTENGLSKLKTFENGRCSALVEGKCAIYSHRPTVCRAYPLYIDMFAGLCTINDCPSTNSDSCRFFVNELHSLVQMYSFWIEHIIQLESTLITGDSRENDHKSSDN